jgi:guanine deaminase
MQESDSNLKGESSGAHSLPALIRGTICHTKGSPFALEDDRDVLEWFEDGALAIDGSGRIAGIGRFEDLMPKHTAGTFIDRRGCLILPGMIDGHIHYPQTLMIGSYGEQLLTWLDKYTFPEEEKYKDEAYAKDAARIFFAELIAHGTTTALIFGAHFEEATGLAFEEAGRRRFRALMGMSLADRNIRSSLRLDHESAYLACSRLIANWHNKGKLRFVVTPRYAPSCSEEMFGVCRRLMLEHTDIMVQTHISENLDEIAWVKELYPAESSYLDVYDRRGLVGPRTVLVHSVHSTDEEISRIQEAEASVVHCPSSNSFMGSGLMPLGKYVDRGIKIALGTDIAAGTGYSLFQEMNQAYKVQMLQLYAFGGKNHAVKLSGERLLYLATLGGATALGLDGEIGNFKLGKYADFLVVDPDLDHYFSARLKNTRTMSEKLFVLATIGSKELIREVYIDGILEHPLPSNQSGQK